MRGVAVPLATLGPVEHRAGDKERVGVPRELTSFLLVRGPSSSTLLRIPVRAAKLAVVRRVTKAQ